MLNKNLKMKPYPMNPTIGTIPENQIVGRERTIIHLLRLLQGQSISLEEMRRMGKTMILLKLAYLCNNDSLPDEFRKGHFKAKYFSFQGKQNLGEVIDELIRELEKMKAWYNIDFSKSYDFIRKIINSPSLTAGDVTFTVSLPEYKKKWKEIFFQILDNIAENQEKKDCLLVLIFDELPIMLWEWYKKGNHEEALELLDILRQKRQHLESKGIRFIYCGSIGIKVVLNTFRTEFGYTGEATNDMEEVSVGPFTQNEANFLCECYALSGFLIEEENKNEMWQMIYDHTNGLPYYISKLFNIIQTDFEKIISKENIISAFNAILNNTNNHKAFNQLIQRLKIYYPSEKSEAMMKILTTMAKSDKYFSEQELSTSINLDADTIKLSLYELYADHYLERKEFEDERQYKFKYEIFRKWWKINIA